MEPALKSVFTLETIDGGTFVVPAGQYHEFPAAEAERLIACGAAADPDKAIASVAAEVAEGGATVDVEGVTTEIVELDASAEEGPAIDVAATGVEEAAAPIDPPTTPESAKGKKK